MKQAFLLVVLTIGVAAQAARPPIDQKILREFSAVFPQAEKIYWTVDATTYEVHFMRGEIRYTIQYDPTAAVNFTVRYYKNAMLLPPMLLIKLHRILPEAAVYGITETASGDGVQYEIILDNDTHWYHVAADAAGGFRLTETFKKG